MFQGGDERKNWHNIGYPITAQCCLSKPPENIRKPKGFLKLSGGIEKQHGAVMG